MNERDDTFSDETQADAAGAGAQDADASAEDTSSTPAGATGEDTTAPSDGASSASGAGSAPAPGSWDAGGEDAEPATPQAVAETAAEFLEGLLAAMGLEAEVATHVGGDTAFLDVTGGDLGVLIGRRGQTLDALQEVVRTAVQRRLRSRVRLLVDVETYRARRRASLAEYAREIAGRAKERGTEIELEPMNAFERKIVHDAVAEIEGVSSFSEGEEPNRKVVVRGE